MCPDDATLTNAYLPEGGEMGRLIRAHPWANTPLGDRSGWPQDLRTAVSIMLASKQPMYIGWTEQLISLYNDAYRVLLGQDKHPGALGMPLADVFGADAYPVLQPVFDALLTRGEAYAAQGALVPLQRFGYLEDCYFDFGYTPIHDAGGRVSGMFVACTEVTERTLAQRRTQLLSALAASTAAAPTFRAVLRAVRDTLRAHPDDVPAALVRFPDGRVAALTDGLDVTREARLALSGWVGAARGRAAPRRLPDAPHLPGLHPASAIQEWVALPFRTPERRADAATLVVGLNPRKRLDESYGHFLELFNAQIAAALARIHAEAQERRHTQHLQRQNEDLDARTRALEGFAELTRDLALHSDPRDLVRRAQEVILSLLPPAYTLYYELDGDRWRNTVQTGDVGHPDLQAFIDAGPPVGHTPSVDLPWTTGQPLYQDQYAKGSDTSVLMVEHVNTAASLPVHVNDGVVGILIACVFQPRPWTTTERAVLETVTRSLGLALERAQRVAEITRRNEELRVANEEIEAFTYSVSHDLMTPVRHITSFAELALRSMDDPARTARFLEIIHRAGGRMSALIDALLQLSRIGRRDIQRRPVNLNDLLAQVQRDLAPDLAGRAVRWHLQPLPEVLGDRETLLLVLHNLVGNAVKYTRQRTPAVIRVWGEEDGRAWTVHVQDNGVGFDEAYAERLFGVFQRLHKAEEFEGTGVGLANVRRVIQRHGGTVQARGAVGEGATFTFTLPKSEG